MQPTIENKIGSQSAEILEKPFASADLLANLLVLNIDKM
jgi:hypothetical protein